MGPFVETEHPSFKSRDAYVTSSEGKQVPVTYTSLWHDTSEFTSPVARIKCEREVTSCAYRVCFLSAILGLVRFVYYVTIVIRSCVNFVYCTYARAIDRGFS